MMQRKIERALYTEIVRYSLSCDLEPVLDYLTDTKYNVGNLKQTTNTHLHELPRFRRLFSQIQEALDDYKEMYEYDCFRIKTVLSWINVSDTDESHHEHSHPNSLISGIFYLKNCSPTFFSSPAIAGRTGIVVQNNHPMTYESAGIQGDLVLFPSYVDHYTMPGTPRCTLSFNTLPEGKCNAGTLIEAQYV